MKAQGKWHSPLVVSKDSKKEGKERERRLAEEDRKAQTLWRTVFFF